MKAAELRQSILQAAVQGKLVPQNLQDKPACELFERIQNEKAHLIKEGKIKKAPPLPEIAANEMPFEIPENWCWVRLGQLTELITSGSRDWAKYYTSTGDIFLRMGNLSRNRFDLRLDKIQYVKLPKNIEGMRTSVQAGDLLFSITGEIGTLGLIPDNFGTAYINQHTAIIRFMTSEKSKFYPYVLLSDYAQNFYNGNQHGIKNSFRLDTIALLPVPLPPLGEQHRIVSKIDELFALCDKLDIAEKRLTALEEHFTEYLPKAILQAAVQGKLVAQNSHDEPASELLKRIHREKAQLIKEGKIKREKPLPPISEDEIPYDLPEGWEWCRLRDIGQIIGGATPDSHESSYYTKPGQGISWLTPADMTKYTQNNYISHGAKDITQAGYNSCSTMLMPPGSIIFSSRAPIGHIAFSSKEVCTNQGFKSVVPYMTAVTPWIFYALKSKVDDIQSRASGTTFKEVSGKFMESETIPLPPLVEQQRIVTKVEELLALCNEMKASYTEPVEFDEVAEIIPFSTSVASEHTEYLEEPLLLAARGDAENLSSEALRAIDDLFAEDEE